MRFRKDIACARCAVDREEFRCPFCAGVSCVTRMATMTSSTCFCTTCSAEWTEHFTIMFFTHTAETRRGNSRWRFEAEEHPR